MFGFEMTSRFIESGHSDQPSIPVNIKVKGCKSHDHFGCLITKCSVNRILSSSSKSHHPWPTCGHVGRRVFYSSARVQWTYSTAPANGHSLIFFLRNPFHSMLIVFHKGLSNSKPSRISWTFLSILTGFDSVVVWKFFTLSLITNFHSLFSMSL